MAPTRSKKPMRGSKHSSSAITQAVTSYEDLKTGSSILEVTTQSAIAEAKVAIGLSPLTTNTWHNVNIQSIVLASKSTFDVECTIITEGPMKGRYALILDPRPTSVFRFLDLPAEIRTMILSELLTLPQPLHFYISKQVACGFQTCDEFGGSINLSILKVSRQVHREARAILLSHNTFYFVSSKTFHKVMDSLPDYAHIIRRVDIPYIPGTAQVNKTMRRLANFPRLEYLCVRSRHVGPDAVTMLKQWFGEKGLTTKRAKREAVQAEIDHLLDILHLRPCGRCGLAFNERNAMTIPPCDDTDSAQYYHNGAKETYIKLRKGLVSMLKVDEK
ncbi:Hypothetical protein D9617_24g016930 [Elsinoe fawcettii]|nr:Hypothetical protein D9617_24g016930 [Elsinoe fawcettii]